MAAAQISPEIVTTVLDFIDYAIAAAVILAIYFAFRFLTYETEEQRTAREAAQHELGEKVKGAWKERGERREQDALVQARRGLLGPAKGFLIRAMQHCDQGRDEFEVQSDRALRGGRNHVQQVYHNLNSARRVMKRAWHHARGEQRDDLHHSTGRVEELRNRVYNEVIGRIPRTHTDPNWGRSITGVRRVLEDVEREIALVIGSIDKCIDENIRIEEKKEAGGATVIGDSHSRGRSSPSPGEPSP